MAKNNQNLTDGEKKELKELIAKKKAKSLSETEAARLQELNEKCGFKGGKSSSKEGFKPGNDFSWWNKIPELLKDAANFKCNYIAGDAIAGQDIPYVVPGVLVAKLICIYGCDARATDPINVWARDLYLKMFHNYRPASGYSASDLAIAIIAGVEVVKIIAKYERIYGVVNRYSRLNINMPLVEASALGLSENVVAYLQGHMSDFRYDLNFLLRKAQRLCIPKDMSVIADAISLFGYEYVDHDNVRGQLILFDSDEYGVYSDTELSSGGSIQFESYIDGELFDFEAENMCVALSEALDALLGSDSIQRIYADLVVWFGQEAMLSFVPIPEDYVVAPMYSESMLHKLHNLECVHTEAYAKLTSWASDQLSSNDRDRVLNGLYHIYQANDVIITRGVITCNGSAEPKNYDGGQILVATGGKAVVNNVCHMVDTYRVEPDAESVTEGVMYKFDAKIATGSSDSTGSAVITTATFYLAKGLQLWTNRDGSPDYVDIRTSEEDNENHAAELAGYLACVDWAPLVYNLIDNGVYNYKIIGVYGDVDQIIPMYHNDLSRLQRTIVLSGLHTDVKSIR